ncbi:MAG TPA: aromatic ring-hydroxylating dioxygenase subunit alpha [Dehalococcoidia bacterium]|nr:aromatic ring-hydroxylating dioxygenase subunit alpha [Dehalococcoidia bacterium]
MEIKDLIIDDCAEGIFRVHRSSMTSLQVLERERETVFERNWLYVGHESEVPNPGDFQRRHVAGRPLFFARGNDGQVRVFLNTCPHRGAMVCRKDKGNTDVFQCFYHAWTFSNNGQLVGVPDEASYPRSFSRAAMSLKSPPKVDSYRGFVFASFNPEIEDLVDYLAGAREYLDLVVDQAQEGMVIVPGSNKYFIRANWKLLVENSFDGYHFPPVHTTYLQFLDSQAGDEYRYPQDRTRVWTRARALGNGHAVMENSTVGRPIASWHPLLGEDARAEIEAIRAQLVEKFGEERTHQMADINRNLLVYPNLIINDISGITLRTFWPLAPDLMEVNAWVMAPREENEAQLYRRLNYFLIFLGPGGFATPDDAEALESCQAGFQARELEWSDISRGMHREGEARSNHELQMRAFWRQWHAQMLGQTGASYWDDLIPAAQR